MTLEAEDSVAGFLGVHIKRFRRSNGEIVLTQKGLIDMIIETPQIEDLPPVSTPARECLGKDEFGDEPNCSFNYASVIGMIWYLYGHSMLDSGFATSQAARFAFRRSLALIRIGQYLKGTREKGLIIQPAKFDSFKGTVQMCADGVSLREHLKGSD